MRGGESDRRKCLALGSALLLLSACQATGASRAEDKTKDEEPVDAAAPSTERREPFAMGQLGIARDYTMSVDGAKECPRDRPVPIRRGQLKVGFEASVNGTTAREVPVNPFYATLVDPSGEKYFATLSGCDPELEAVRVTHGRTARGFVTFEVPLGTQTYVLVYAPPVLGTGREELKFAVSR